MPSCELKQKYYHLARLTYFQILNIWIKCFYPASIIMFSSTIVPCLNYMPYISRPSTDLNVKHNYKLICICCWEEDMLMLVFKLLLFLVVLNSKPIFQDQLKQKKKHSLTSKLNITGKTPHLCLLYPCFIRFGTVHPSLEDLTVLNSGFSS